MSTLILHHIDDEITTHLQLNATKHHCSIEDEVNRIPQQALFPNKSKKKLGSHLHQQIITLSSDTALELPKRSLPRPAPNFLEELE